MKEIDYSKVEEMIFFYADMNKSKEFCDKFSQFIKIKECYDNVSRVFNNYKSLSKDYPDIHIVYGGVQIIPSEYCDSNLFVKHCFFKLRDKIIDPTLYKNKSLKEQTKYFSVIEYDVVEYLDMLIQYQETFPVDIMRKLNKVSMDLIKHNIAYAG